MKTRREIHSLDYALCVLVSLLDRVFRGRLKEWDVSKGFNITVEDERKQPSDSICVRIRPAGRKTDQEIVAFYWESPETGWQLVMGSVFPNSMLRRLGGSFTFRATGPFAIRPYETVAQEFVKKVCPDWFE